MDFNVLNSLIEPRNQSHIGADNVLLPEVMGALSVDTATAKTFMSSTCKFLTFWIEANFKGLYTDDFPTYLKLCVKNGWVRAADAYLTESYGISDGSFQHTFADKFNINSTAVGSFDAFNTYAAGQTEFVGILRIVSNTGGKHSLICYKADGKLLLSDTSYRGIGVDMNKFISSKNFIYFTTMTV